MRQATDVSAENELPAAYSLWLLPQAADAARLDALIADLAPTFATAAFRAHVTVQGDLATPLAKLREIAAELASAVRCVDFTVAEVACSPHYYRSLYLALAPAAHFARLQARAAELTGTVAGLSPFPHLSLAYGEPAETAHKAALRRRYAEQPQWPGRLLCDRLALVRSAQNVPLAQWSLLESFALGTR